MTITSTSTTAQAYALAPGAGERIWITGDTMSLKATGATTGGKLVFLENITPPGGGPPAHTHAVEDEFFYVVDGTFEIRVGDERHTLGAGGFAYVPAGVPHSFRNVADTPSLLLAGFTPAGIEGFFREAGQPATDDGPAPAISEEELARNVAAVPKYGLAVVD